MAGCVGDDKGSTVDAPTNAVESGLGRLEITIVDDLVVPLPGAVIVLDGIEKGTTDTEGRSVLDLPPGRVEALATLEGYAPDAKAIDIIEAETVRTTLTLVPNAIAESYHETRIQSGTIGCSFGNRVNSPNTSYFAICAVGSLVTNTSQVDDPFLNWHLDSIWTGITGFWGETQWQSSQALGTGMFVDWFVLDVRFGGTASYKIVSLNTTEGRSPLAVRIPVDLAQEANSEQATGTGLVCPESGAQPDCWLLSGHYASARTVDQAVDVGVTVQQRYTDYLTIFYGEVFPEVFSALPEA